MISTHGQSFITGLADQEAYWRKTLVGDLPEVRIYPDFSRPPVSSFIKGDESIKLCSRLCGQLRSICVQEDVPLFVILLSAFKILLQRHTGQEDIVVGSVSPDSIRRLDGNRNETFANPVALRTDLQGNPEFMSLLKVVHKTVQDVTSNRDYPFEKIIERTCRQQYDGSSLVFHNMFVLCDAAPGVSPAPVTEKELADVEDRVARCDLVIIAREDQGTVLITCKFDADLFESSTIIRLLGRYRSLINEIVVNSDQRISAFPFVAEAEQHRLLAEWNDTKSEYPKDKCIHELFEEQAAKSPDAVALIFEDKRLTYRELNQRANQLAHCLRKHGIGPETLVGICVERSLEMVIGLLGILKTGGAYVPLDPEYPKEHLSFMLADSGARVLLTQEGLMERLPGHDARVLCSGKEWGHLGGENDVHLDAETTAQNLAYVIYTSGSTGRPKGVEVTHRGVIRLLFGVGYTCFGPSGTFIQLASISFDAATFEIWGALLHGGRCVLFPGNIPTPVALREIIDNQKITTLWLTSSLFNLVMDEIPLALSGVRQLLIGGEALSVAHVRRALKVLPATQIINGYGPTEATTFTCCYPITIPVEQNAVSIPIGRPIANTEVYILGGQLEPLPIGVVGELYVGGDGLARGYLNRPELTAEKFIANPFSPEPGARLYRTGDLARYLPDGNIEFIGRMDNQVKMRGFRIELGEIEAILNQHPKVRDAVAIVRENCPGDKRLVGYVVAGLEGSFDAAEVRKYLQQKLPEYMIPSALVLLDELPLTPNGKVDRRALPAPNQSRPELEDVYQAPRTSIEDTLARIWAEVLKVDKVGIDDNFFDLGGHSLLATQIISRVRSFLSIELPLRTLFESPTVAELATELAQRMRDVEATTEKEAQKLLAI